MESYALGALGIAVSVTLFLIGYRQTIGARRERAASANSDLEKMIIRRIFLEAYTPSVADISLLIEGKAREYRLKIGDILSEAQILTGVFTRIVESDFIPAKQRQATLSRLQPIMKQASVSLLEERILPADPYRQRRRTRALIAAMGLSASLAGTLFATFSLARGTQVALPDLLPFLVSTMIVSLTLIAGTLAFLRLRDFQAEQSSRQTAIDQSSAFERDVVSALRKLRTQIEPVSGAYAGDYVLTHGSRRILLEVKSWTSQPPRHVTSRLFDNLKAALGQLRADEAIIVTPSHVSLGPVIRGRSGGGKTHVRAMTLGRLVERLSSPPPPHTPEGSPAPNNSMEPTRPAAAKRG